ncbi:Crp/Fnr family transcriptional regulator [Paenibacillus sp. YIM B09110]|uniref:Crp/Fnr family transcriptional regulator n=1 Tax=Paenibacillus sp. YIM B09110 TaxID=3126102 RepID=UPI00301D3000
MEKNQEEYDALKKLMGPLAVPDQDWEIFVKRTMVRKLKRDYFAVRAGETVHCAYFCIKGLFRFFYTLDDGKEFTKSFALEGDIVTSYGAMISGEPSYFSIQALEEALVIEIPYTLLLELVDRSRHWERFLRHSVEQLYKKKEERERELLYLSAAERLEAFKMKYPGLEARIPQYFIASYLGISPVSLSRIVNQSKT